MAKKGRLTIKNHFRESHIFMRRIYVLVFIVVASTVLLMSRLVYLQIMEHDTYKTLSIQNQLSLIPIEPNRGLIYDRNGVLLAENVPIFSLEVVPESISNLKATIKQLKEFIDITPQDLKRFYKEMSQHRPFQSVPLKLKLTEEEVAKFYLRQFAFPGVSIQAGMIRHYPFGEQFSHVLGYVARINEQEMKEIDQSNYSGSNSMGKLGVEKYYEKQLHGIVGYQQVEVDANGRSVRTLKRYPPVSGDSIYLTLDSRLQLKAEELMANEKGAVVMIVPKTGEVLALVSYPGFDPNPFVIGIDTERYKELRDSFDKPLYNRAIRGQYPFASTIKPYLAIAGLDTNTITVDFRIHDPGFFTIPGVRHVYRDWRKNGHGVVNLPKAITQSCDVYFYGLSVKLNINRMANYLRKFGFGEVTGIDMVEELPGLIPSTEWKMKKYHVKWFTGDTVSAAIGQGYILATPLQLAQGVAIIATRGIRFRPRLLLKSEKPDGTIEELKPIPLPPVILKNEKTWKTIIDAMVEVTSTPQGTAAVAFAKTPYSVAGKTGTAQLTRIVGENIHGGDRGLPKHLRNHKLFIAFAPAENPEIALAVLIENSTIAPKVARQLLDYYFITLLHKYPPPEVTTTTGITIDGHSASPLSKPKLENQHEDDSRT